MELQDRVRFPALALKVIKMKRVYTNRQRLLKDLKNSIKRINFVSDIEIYDPDRYAPSSEEMIKYFLKRYPLVNKENYVLLREYVGSRIADGKRIFVYMFKIRYRLIEVK